MDWMKKYGRIMIKKSFCLWLMIMFLWIGHLFGQQENEVLQETVRVVNVEVPVRVYYKGKPVDNLTKNDFKLFEGRKRQDIHGFILKRKKIKVQKLELNAEQVQTRMGRYFVLVFRITHYNKYIKEGLDYIFETVLNESDQLLVFANDRTVFFKSLSDKMDVKTKLDRILHDVSLEARKKMLMYLVEIEKEVNKHKFEMTLRSGRGGYHVMISRYLKKFLDIWKIYKKKYLIPDINKYYNFARFLKTIDKEKWVINFYQFEVFPDIIISSDSMRLIMQLIGQWQVSGNQELSSFSRILSRQIIEIEKELSVARDFPSEEVAKIFHNVDTTFHSIFMKTTLGTLMQDMEYREVASELESSLRAITNRTGGKLVVSNKLDKALDRISEVEDVYYMLTYAPKDPDNVGKIKVKLNNRKYKLVYSPNLRTGFLSQFLEEKQIKRKPVKIEDLKFKKGKLMFGISDFFWHKKEGGMLSIRIRVKDQQGNSVFDQKKNIKATQKKINIALNISGLKKGEYNVVVDVNDLFTKMSSTQLLKTTISNQP
jgi:hypothetical protein